MLKEEVFLEAIIANRNSPDNTSEKLIFIAPNRLAHACYIKHLEGLVEVLEGMKCIGADNEAAIFFNEEIDSEISQIKSLMK